MGLKLPWCWRTGPSTASERSHLLELAQKQFVFPSDTLFCGDAGFVGYEFWRTIVDHGHSFLIRVGANVHLLKNLGTARQSRGLVYLWPDAAARKRQPPLVLRLLEFQGPRGKVCLVTNVLSDRQLSFRQAGELYRLRWGVELQFRTLKQTFRRSKLRSRTADKALVELHWSLVGLSLERRVTQAMSKSKSLARPPRAASRWPCRPCKTRCVIGATPFPIHWLLRAVFVRRPKTATDEPALNKLVIIPNTKTNRAPPSRSSNKPPPANGGAIDAYPLCGLKSLTALPCRGRSN